MVLLYLPHVNLGPDLSVGWIWINTLTTLVTLVILVNLEGD